MSPENLRAETRYKCEQRESVNKSPGVTEFIHVAWLTTTWYMIVGQPSFP
jgi:hypothetical protein